MLNIRADRLSKLPPYLFVKIDQGKRTAMAQGRDVIDFGVGDPDLPTPAFILDETSKALSTPGSYNYTPTIGLIEYRRAAAHYMKCRFGVTINPENEVIALLGSKEGIGHLPLAVINPADVVLVPQPGYPVYESGTIFAGGVTHTMPLTESNDWLPDLTKIPAEVCRQAKLMWINYPNNPTSACASLDFFKQAIAFAKAHDILLAHDSAYGEVYFDEPPPSILQVHGAREVAIEFHSLSKTFNMTGWRTAFAVGHADALAALAKIKSNLDSGMFEPIQHAGIAAMEGFDRPEIVELRNMYRHRRDVIVSALREAGWSVTPPQATFYLWAKCPPGHDSWSVATRLLDEADIVVIPGAGFGETGEGFVRFSLTVNEDRVREAAARIAKLSW
ncbi:LL-diaminopimelate aminotransferase [bacterium AH-315-J04]|nr:LL-diaminopimelate aminotransferase [bacterium AH-315-J04]